MHCPYCLSEVDEAASVCKTCTRDIYLFKPMMAKLADLEVQLQAIPNQEAYEARISELEAIIVEHTNHQAQHKKFWHYLLDIAIYLVTPLLLLVLAHLAIAVIYDTKMVYLRIISMILPLPFGYFLFSKQRRSIFPWFLGVVLLAISSVIGMSWVTSLVDHSPVLPDSMAEWRELMEYASSIAFSFLTGMLLGGVTYASKHQHKMEPINPFFKAAISGLSKDKLSPQAVHGIMKTINEYGGTVVALCTTALSIYTGLKHVL